MVTTLEHNTRMRRTKDTRARTPLSTRRTTLTSLNSFLPSLSVSLSRCLLKRKDKVFGNIAKLKIWRIVILKNQLPHKVACPLSFCLPRVESRRIFPVCLMTNACLHECEHIRSERGAARNITRTSEASPGIVVGN